MGKALHINRYFTKEGKGPYEGIKFVKRKSELRNADGSLIFSQDNITAPEPWSQISVDILAQKYFRRKGIPKTVLKEGFETDARQVFHRLSKTWTEWGKRSGYFASDGDAAAFYDEMCYMLSRQMAAPNSPQWFNTGLHEVYGIEGPSQGHYFFNPLTGEVEESKTAYERPQPHACFILDVKDDLVNKDGIMDSVTREARLFKYGSGAGSNFSNLRSRGETLSGGGYSSGLLSFLKIFDRSASAIKSGGTTRRAAKMVILDINHPDIEDFIDWKTSEEYKVAALVTGSTVIRKLITAIKNAVNTGENGEPDFSSNNQEMLNVLSGAKNAGIPRTFLLRMLKQLSETGTIEKPEEFTVEWDGEAYNTVSGQSSNNSVRLTNDFMTAVKNNAKWQLLNRTDNKPVRTVDAGYLWEKIAVSAWKCADPGVQFHTTINQWHTCPQSGPIRGSNPCSEYMFLDNTACNLASLNLMTFYDKEQQKFDIEAYTHAIRLWTIVLEISIVMAQFPGPSIALRSYEYRTLGLGFANLGSLLMVQGHAYDSAEGRSIAAALSAILTGQSYATSAELARAAGPFKQYVKNADSMLKVIRNHHRAAYNAPSEEYEGLSILPQGIDHKLCPADLAEAARQAWDKALAEGETHGYRNAQVTAIAPTGTIGLVMDCDTTGVEPDYALVKYKKLAGGGYFKIINNSVPAALKALGYSEIQQKEIIAYCAGNGTFKKAPGISLEDLKAKGIGRKVLDSITAACRNAFNLDGIFNKFILDDETYNKLGINIEYTGFEFLSRLGFDETDIKTARNFVLGHMNMNGAPHLKKEHLPVFDTATASGEGEERFIKPKAHIDMMAAVQPFVSGAISKTINMPGSASIKEVQDAYEYSWRKMLKAVALYRDGSKLSQPLSGLEVNGDRSAMLLAEAAQASAAHENAKQSPEPAAGRKSLPNRRKGYTQKAKIAGHSIFMRTGDYTDGELGEIFLDMHKEGAAFRSLLNSFAIAVSLGLQYGVPLEEYVDAFTFTRFEPNGMVAGHANIKMATSVLDFIFRDLALTYLQRTDLVQVKPDDLISTGTGAELPSEDSAEFATSGIKKQSGAKRTLGYEGDPCPSCGHLTLVRNGTCLKCMTCGGTTGCS